MCGLFPTARWVRTRAHAAAILAGAVLTSLLLAGCDRPSSQPQSAPQTELGKGGSEVSGSAGPAGNKESSPQLAQCEKPVATVALLENPNGYTGLGAYNLPPSPLPLIRLIIQQSGCFRVVDRAGGLAATIREQELRDQGVVRKSGNPIEKGRGIEALYTMAPSLTFSERDAGRGFAGLLASVPVIRDLAAIIGIIEQTRLKEAQTVLILTDNETTEQVAAATGSARITDFGLGGLVIGNVGAAGSLGWSNSNEGKVIAAAFLDAHNKLVTQLRAMKPRTIIQPAPSR